MAEEVKNTAATEEAAKEPKIVYAYKIVRYDNGLYDFEGLPLEEGGTPTIDQFHIATDVVDLGRKLDHQLTVEEAEQRVMNRLAALAQQQEAAAQAPADPTKAE